jgi:hypothetical protein
MTSWKLEVILHGEPAALLVLIDHPCFKQTDFVMLLKVVRSDEPAHSQLVVPD